MYISSRKWLGRGRASGRIVREYCRMKCEIVSWKSGKIGRTKPERKEDKSLFWIAKNVGTLMR